MTDIIINLNEDRDAYIVEKPKDIIHVNELNQVWGLLEESIMAAKDYENSEAPFKRKHDTIMLAGVRGSGKTTFMLSLLQYVRRGHMKFECENVGSWQKEGYGIEVLKIFDPTLIEDRVHVFINIISLIKDSVDEKAKKSNCFKDPDSDNARDYKAWEKSFKKLADGLPAINGVGHDEFSGDAWLDSEFIMDKGVGRAHAANHLERNFHEFVRKSLKFIGKTAFLLCFDDIDTSFGRGWPVLEVLHKYLTTPQFVTILSGDAHLYSILIRDHQWANFSDVLLKMEAVSGTERTEYRDTVSHLEEQHLLKLLKQERRVFLSSIYQKMLYDAKSVFKISVDKEGKDDKELYDTYVEMMNKLGVEQSERKDTFRFLASQPLRTQKQLLYAHLKMPKKIAQSIIEIFWTDLASKKVDVSSLRNAPQHVTMYLLDYLVRNKIISEGFGLTPIYSDSLMNGAQFALSSIMSDQINKDPSQIFEYWLRVCMAREMGILMGDRTVARGEGPSLQNFIDHCAFNQRKATRYLARHSTAYMRAFRGFNFETRKMDYKRYELGAWHGTLPLYARAETIRGSKEDNFGRIDEVLNNAEPFMRIMGSLPLSGATDHNKRALPIYSIYNLLGIIGQVINYARENRDDLTESSKKVAALLYRNSQFREYPLPTWASTYNMDRFEGDEQSSLGKEYENVELMAFSEDISKWARIDLNNSISASMLGKVFTRLFYSLNNLDKGFSSNQLGEWFHRMIVIFLHSSVVVEAMEQIDIAEHKINLTNPVTKDTVFVDNLKKIINAKFHEDDTKFVFSKWLLSCPIWNVYLKFKLIDMDIFAEHFILTKTIKYKSNLHDLLENVAIKDKDIPRYSSNNLLHHKDLEDVFTENKVDIIDIPKWDDAELLDFMVTHLGYKYIITVTNARAVKKKIAAEAKEKIAADAKKKKAADAKKKAAEAKEKEATEGKEKEAAKATDQKDTGTPE